MGTASGITAFVAGLLALVGLGSMLALLFALPLDSILGPIAYVGNGVNLPDLANLANLANLNNTASSNR